MDTTCLNGDGLVDAGRLTWYGDAGFSTFMRRAFAKGMGYTDEDIDRPIIGIATAGAS